MWGCNVSFFIVATGKDYVVMAGESRIHVSKNPDVFVDTGAKVLSYVNGTILGWCGTQPAMGLLPMLAQVTPVLPAGTPMTQEQGVYVLAFAMELLRKLFAGLTAADFSDGARFSQYEDFVNRHIPKEKRRTPVLTLALAGKDADGVWAKVTTLWIDAQGKFAGTPVEDIDGNSDFPYYVSGQIATFLELVDRQTPRALMTRAVWDRIPLTGLERDRLITHQIVSMTCASNAACGGAIHQLEVTAA